MDSIHCYKAIEGGGGKMEWSPHETTPEEEQKTIEEAEHYD
jgi:hypothetical protein